LTGDRAPGDAAYRSRFAEWDQQAWVRSKPHRSAPFSDRLQFFSPDLCPLLRHPQVRAAPASTQRAILVHALYLHLEFTVRLETGPVNEVCLLLRSPDFLPWLPAGMRDDALRIYTDEAGHAEMSHALMARVHAASGVEPVRHEPRFLVELARISAAQPPTLRRLVTLFFVIVSETLITATLTGLPRDERVQPAVRELAADHAADEGRHHAYFRQLFEYLWPRLPAPLRRQVGMLLPEIVEAFLWPDEPVLTAVLAAVDGGFEAPARIVAELVADDRVRADVRAGAQPTLRMLIQHGVLDDPPVRAAFERRRLVDVGQPH
jgi:hypothetical protein